MLTNPSELLEFLRTLRVHPKKGFSQNFLIDGNIMRKILETADVHAGDSVFEIGPGPGALTEALMAKGAHVIAIEKDPVYAEALKRFPKVDVYSGDILDFDVELLPWKIKVVSNIPYHLTAPILSLLVPRYEIFTSITLMVQEEVARRMTAQPKTKDYGSLAVFLNFYSETKYAFKVSRNCFYPKPKVDSAVVTIKPRQPPDAEADAFFTMVRAVFQHRRKMVKTTLGLWVEDLLYSLGENPKARPEELSLEVFLKIFRKINAL
jgi:16S rRNA (adenine1518-N6/adenine1519-N6)-dimethyltransferase